MTADGKRIVEINNAEELTDDQLAFAEAEMEWFAEARAEGMTWKRIADHYGLCMYQTKKFFGKKKAN